MRQIACVLSILCITAIFGLSMAGEVLACASCGGSLNTDWQNLDYTFTPGLKIDFRYDFLDQNQLRSGNGTISPAAASKRVNANGPQEVEQYTRNNYLTLGLDYTPNINWGIDLQAPYIIRSHSTLGTNSDGTTAGPGGGQYNFSSANLGDLKVIGRYQGLTEKHNLGLLFGFKLATGSYTETGNSTDPTAPGPAPIDRGLQPGSGTTDVIVGAYYNNAINHYLGYFTLATYQAALYSTDSYRPGNSLNATAGVRYVGFVYVIPQIQFNFHNSQRDTGAMADNISTGGSQLYISPGIVAAASDRVSLYSFVQVPVYQYVNGVQLAPRFTVSAGVRYAF